MQLHIDGFKSVVVNLDKLEVKYDEEDLALLLLCSLPLCFPNFRNTMLYGHDNLNFKDVQEALLNKESINKAISGTSSSNQRDGLIAHGKSQVRNTNDKNQRPRSKSKSRYKDIVCNYCKKKSHIKRHIVLS
jgi:hypothetical protein